MKKYTKDHIFTDQEDIEKFNAYITRFNNLQRQHHSLLKTIKELEG